MVFLICLILTTASITSRLLTESSCSLSYVFYPFQTVYSTASPTITQTTSYISSGLDTYNTSPYVVLLARKGNQTWKVSVLDEAHAKEYKVKGEKFLKEKTGETWYTHDKIDDNFKQPFARCQALNRELKARKSLRTKTFENKVVNELPDLLEKINDSPSTTTNTKKVSDTVLNKSEKPTDTKTPVEKVKSTTTVCAPGLHACADRSCKTSLEECSPKKPSNALKLESTATVCAPGLHACADRSCKASLEECTPNKPIMKVQEPQKDLKVATSVNTPVPITIKPNLAAQPRFLQKKFLPDEEDGFDDDTAMDKFNGDIVAPVKTEEIKAAVANNADNAKEDDDSAHSDNDDDEDSVKDDDGADDSHHDDKNENKLEDEIDGDELQEDSNELADDEKVVESEDTEGLMDMEEEDEQEHMEEDLVHDLNPYNEDNPDLL